MYLHVHCKKYTDNHYLWQLNLHKILRVHELNWVLQNPRKIQGAIKTGPKPYLRHTCLHVPHSTY